MPASTWQYTHADVAPPFQTVWAPSLFPRAPARLAYHIGARGYWISHRCHGGLDVSLHMLPNALRYSSVCWQTFLRNFIQPV